MLQWQGEKDLTMNYTTKYNIGDKVRYQTTLCGDILGEYEGEITGVWIEENLFLPNTKPKLSIRYHIDHLHLASEKDIIGKI